MVSISISNSRFDYFVRYIETNASTSVKSTKSQNKSKLLQKRYPDYAIATNWMLLQGFKREKKMKNKNKKGGEVETDTLGLLSGERRGERASVAPLLMAVIAMTCTDTSNYLISDLRF